MNFTYVLILLENLMTTKRKKKTKSNKLYKDSVNQIAYFKKAEDAEFEDIRDDDKYDLDNDNEDENEIEFDEEKDSVFFSN